MEIDARCIQKERAGEDTDMIAACTELSRTMPSCEIEVFVISAARGDVFPACLRLSQARADEAWLDRLNIALAVGPACPARILDMACQYMPKATEPRLLRAASALRFAAMAKDDEERDLFNDAARRDLLDILEVDETDLTARSIVFELLGSDHFSAMTA